MADVYYILNWPYHEHRDMSDAKRHSWVKAKVDFQGDDWLKITKADDPCAVLATWEIVRGIALQSPYRGLLLQDSHVIEPHNYETISEKSRFPLEKVRFGLCYLVATVRWVGLQRNCKDFAKLSSKLWRKRYASNRMRRYGTTRDFRGNGAENPQSQRGKSAPTLHNITVHNNTEHNKQKEAAERLAMLYLEVKPSPHDTSRHQGKKNIAKILRVEAYSEQDLERAVRNYRTFCEAQGTDYGYRKNLGNFFGRDRVFEEFVSPDWKLPNQNAGGKDDWRKLSEKHRKNLEAKLSKTSGL